MNRAYLDGRASKDPSESWYKGELACFDFYVIPLAKKLKSCGVFGVSSDEYLTYALQNRKEWELQGQQAVAELNQSVQHWADPRRVNGHDSFIPPSLLYLNDEPVPRRMSQSNESIEYTHK